MNKYFIYVFFLFFFSEFSSKNLGNLWWKSSAHNKEPKLFNFILKVCIRLFRHKDHNEISFIFEMHLALQQFTDWFSIFGNNGLWDLPGAGGPCAVRNYMNIARVQANIEENPETSTWRRYQQLLMCRLSLKRILHNLHLYPYMIQVKTK